MEMVYLDVPVESIVYDPSKIAGQSLARVQSGKFGQSLAKDYALVNPSHEYLYDLCMHGAGLV